MSKQKRSSALVDFRRAVLLKAIAFIVLPFCFAYSQTTPPADNAPQLRIDRTSHNFGEVFVGEVLSTVFRVQNLGTKALELSDRPILVPRRVSARSGDIESVASFAKAGARYTPHRAAPS